MVPAKLLLQSFAWKALWHLFPSFIHPGSYTLMGYPRLGIGGRKLSPQSLPELNGLEPTRNRLLKSWHMKKKRMYGKEQTQNARAISLGKWNCCWGASCHGSASRKIRGPPTNLYKNLHTAAAATTKPWINPEASGHDQLSSLYTRLGRTPFYLPGANSFFFRTLGS